MPGGVPSIDALILYYALVAHEIATDREDSSLPKPTDCESPDSQPMLKEGQSLMESEREIRFLGMSIRHMSTWSCETGNDSNSPTYSFPAVTDFFAPLVTTKGSEDEKDMWLHGQQQSGLLHFELPTSASRIANYCSLYTEIFKIYYCFSFRCRTKACED
ncbi:hypothetical protein SARC_07085 [Sphaeroforma arctica JP610]|uniref:Uncharacterized protein n=1 Tax=Sphaeroforma arctica JP610 TaxID=667725 RepID=A0A0L0FX73_9EUKA|nr:hypothetical protein SARC_07085 [Sphaeroforma arctica JP610]KNC80553.1 hypothetical protein SARC_07085 [Sphaeroforma arctica JP610]|eukprot:XP_014154455.1 hypothetical protein SARC_07085 [Sphaeroforma arctica JP610]